MSASHTSTIEIKYEFITSRVPYAGPYSAQEGRLPPDTQINIFSRTTISNPSGAPFQALLLQQYSTSVTSTSTSIRCVGAGAGRRGRFVLMLVLYSYFCAEVRYCSR